MPSYKEEIYEWISNSDSTFKADMPLEEFSNLIDNDDEYVSEIHEYIGSLDDTFIDDIDLETFSIQMRGGEGEDEKKKEKEITAEADESVTSITTEIPTSQAEVDAKYDGYLSTLLKNPEEIINAEDITLEDLKLDQKIALDDNGQPLVGNELLEYVQGIQKDKNNLSALVKDQEDEVEYAKKIKALQLKSVPTKEEIQQEISNTYQSWGDKTLEEENTYSEFLDIVTNLQGGMKDTEGNVKVSAEEYESFMIPSVGKPAMDTYLKSYGGGNSEWASKNAKEFAQNELTRQEDQYKRFITQLKSAGVKLSTDKEAVEKSNGELTYVPKVEEVMENPMLLKEIKLDEKDITKAKEIAVKAGLAKKKFESKEIREELDEILDDFEGEKGVSAWNNVVNVYATMVGGMGIAKAGMESTLGVTLDELLGMKEGSREAYKKNQKELADIIGLSQKGDELKIASTMWDIQMDAKELLAKEAALKKMHRDLEENPNRTQEDIDNFYALRDELQLGYAQVKANYEYLGDLEFSGTNVDEILQKTQKSYDELNLYENIFYNSGVRIVTGLGALMQELNTVNVLEWAGVDLNDENVRNQIVEYTTDVFGEEGGEFTEGLIDFNLLADKNGDELLKDMNEFGQGLLDSVKEQQRFDEIDGVMDGLAWGTQMLTGQVLNTAMSVVIPYGGGLIIAAASEAGNQMYDMKKRIDGEEWSADEKKYIQDFKSEFGFNPLGDDDIYKVKPEDINALQFYGTAAIYGAAEYFSEKITLGNFKFGAKNLRKAFDLSKTKGLVSSNKLNQRWINLKSSTKDFAKGVPGESFGEGFVTLSQNFSEKYILGNKDVSLLDGMTESMVSGAVMSGTMQGPAIMAQTYQAFRGPDRNAKIAERGDQIVKLSNSIKENEYKLSFQKKGTENFKQLQEAIALDTKRMHELAKEQLADQSKIRSEILSFTPNDRQQLIDIFNKEHKIRHEIDKINDNKQITPETAEAQIADLQKQLIAAEAVKNHTLANAEWNADKKRSNDFANAYRAKNGTLGDVKMIVGNNNKEALDAGLKYVDSRQDLTSEEKNAVKEQMKEQFEIADLASRGDQTVNGMAFGDNLTIETTDANNVTTEKTVNLPMTFAMNKDNLTVQSHEIGHHTLFKQFMEENPDAVGLVQDLESYVKRNYSEAYNNFLETTELYGKYDSHGKIQNETLLAEEKLARLSDFMRQSKMKGGDMGRTLHNKLFGRFQKFNDGSGQIRTGKDVFDMLMSFNDSFESGTLTGLTKSIAEGTAEVSRKKKSLKELTKPKPRKMSKLSMTKAEQDQIEDKLNELPGPKGPDGNYLMTKDQWQADKDRALSQAITIAMDGDLDGLIIEKMERGKTIHDLSREEFMRRVYTKLGMHVYNFDPSISRSLFGWINTYLGSRVGDVANQAKRQKAPTPTIKLDKKISDEGSRTVADTIKGDDADSIIDAIDAKDAASRQEAVIDNLRTRLGIEKGGPLYNKVVAAVEKTLGRTKLKDVSNIKFKQDLKNKFNTELFKAVKNSLGTRAAYKNFIEGDVVFKNKDGKEVRMPRIKMLFDYFAQEVFNKRFESFKEKLIDPSTGKQARPENNPLFRKRDNITKKELIDYFLGSDVKASTKGTRKDALASAIAQELAFDATMEVLEDADIQNNIKEFYELQGLRQAENFTEKVGKIIDRKPGAKFSVTKDGTIRDNTSILDNALDFFNSKESEITSGKDVINIIDNYYNSLDKEAQDVIRPYLDNMKKAANEVIKGELTIDKLRQAAVVRSKTGKKGFELESFPSWNRGKNSYINQKFPEGEVTLPSKEKGGAYSIKGEQRLKNFVSDFSNTLDPTIAELPFFRNTITASGNLKLQSAIDAQNAAIKKAGGTGINDINFNKSNNTYTNPKTKKITKIPARSLTQDVAKKDWINVNKDNTNDFKQKYPDIDPSLAKPITESEYKHIENKIIKRFSETKDLTDPNVQLELTNEINKYLDPENKGRLKAVEAVRDYFYSKLNEYVNQYPKGSKKYFQAIGDVIALLQEQTNSATGIARGGAYLKSLTLDFKQDGKPYQREHNLQLLNFNANVLNSIIENTFDTKYESLVSQYSQSLLDTDAQKVLDGKMTTKEFLEKYKDFNPELLKALQGKTGLLPGYLSGMQSESIFALALGNASRTLMLEFGTTLDNVIYNQLAGQKGLNYLNDFVKQTKSKLSKSPMGKTILNTNNKSAIFESKENKDLFNEVLSEVANDQNIDNTSIELGIKLENKENYNNRDKANNKLMKDSGVIRKFSISKNTNKDVINQATVMDKALNIARNPKAPIKKIRVFDFDDTLARTKSNVFYTMPDGSKGKLTAEQFAEQGDSILEQGGEFDFSDFNKVRDGKPGPLLEVAKKIQAVRGTQDVFVLTARSPQSQLAIKKFLDSVGLNIPLNNITGLGDSTGAAKANWIVDKAAEGYNDFYFADDAMQNVKAVKDALSVIDVKSSVQQAKIKFSKTVDQTVNDIIQHKFGIKSEAEYSDVKARLVGRKKGKFKFFLPPSAEDFVGLLYSMLGKGEVGNMQMEFFKEHLIEPYGRAMENLSRDQNRMINDFKQIKAQLVKEGLIPKNLNKKAFGEFTFQDVARILAWNKQGFDIPGISKTDLNEVLKFAEKNPAIDVFAQNLIDINKGDGYAKPGKDWLAGTISTDLLDGLRTGKRSKYLEQWQENVDLIFSKKNLNKMEAAMGSKWREAMENMLDRMRTGKNRTSNAGRLENRLLDYVNNSVGTVMFFNMRSAVLQTISAINFINWGNNNILKAGIAFANQPQYWADFMELMNSEFLVERRNGLKLNISESEIADAAATSKNKAKAAIAYILQKGYLPTQFADSFAIASGGATFYRNRIKSLMKKGMSEADAKKQAFLEFREIAEESQQSSRPDRISQQQASGLGRVILAFANTPMQYNRLIKKAFQDLYNRRKKPGQNQFQSDIGNISKMAYYAVIQNVIFNALQQAVFALSFDDEEDEHTKQKYYNVANGMLDSILKGAGIAGVGASTLLAMIRKVHKEYQKEGTFPGPAYADAAWELLNFSPPIDIKASKLRIAGNTWKYEGWKHDEANWGIDDPAWKSAAYVISALTNVPVDRLFKKMDNIQGALDSEEETWKRISQALGWTKWQLETSEEIKEHRAQEKDKKKQSLKQQYGPSNPEVYNKEEQKDILKQHGYSDEEIKAMKKEEDRVNAILQKQKESGKIFKPLQMRSYFPKKILTLKEMQELEEKKKKEQAVIKQQQAKQAEFDKYKKLKKGRQVEMLDSLGLSKKEIRALQYEKDRVAKLIELMNK